MGDRIAVSGWEFGLYRRNPVVLWAHDASQPPIGRMTKLFTTASQFIGDVRFASADAYPFADTVYRLVVDGFIAAGSVGFIPVEWTFTSDPDRPMGIDFKRQELLEFSICPIPANANALVEGRALRSRRATDDSVRELGGMIGRAIRAARLRNAVPAMSTCDRAEYARELRQAPPPGSMWERRAIAERLRRQILED
jgi:HK97 family phage prohead protease